MLAENQRCTDKIFSRDFRDTDLIKNLTIKTLPSVQPYPSCLHFIVAYVILNVILTADDVIMYTDRLGGPKDDVSSKQFP